MLYIYPSFWTLAFDYIREIFARVRTHALFSCGNIYVADALLVACIYMYLIIYDVGCI
jgi:hypothetical protein